MIVPPLDNSNLCRSPACLGGGVSQSQGLKSPAEGEKFPQALLRELRLLIARSTEMSATAEPILRRAHAVPATLLARRPDARVPYS